MAIPPTSTALLDRLGPALDGAEAVLEIGCGPGVGIAQVAGRLATARVCGIDPSSTMLSQAGRRARPFADRVELCEGGAESLPWPPHTFDVVFSVNSAQVWPQLELSARETARVLTPSGRLGLALHQRAVRPDGSFVDAVFLDELERALTSAGYENVHTDRVTVRGGYATLIVATAAGSTTTIPG